MEKIKFGIIGGGWRAEYFIRITRALPDRFEVAGALLRNREKASSFKEKFNIPVIVDFNEFLKMELDYAILAVKPEGALGNIERLFRAGVPVLCETPPAASREELAALWQLVEKHDGKIQVAEQYFAQPLYGARLKAAGMGLIGEVSNISISALHGYHGVNIARRFLGDTSGVCSISGKRHAFPVVKTGGREGRCFSGEMTAAIRDRITLEFENGKTAFYDFSGTQYHSGIRTRQLNVQGTRGEVDDLTIRYLNRNNEVVTQTLFRDDMGIYDNSDWSHIGLMLGDVYLYRSPFPSARLNDDEIAVARNGTPVQTQRQIWSE